MSKNYAIIGLQGLPAPWIVCSFPYEAVLMKRNILIVLGLLLTIPAAFSQQRAENNEGSKSYCVLPLPADLSIGSPFDGTRLTAILSTRLGKHQGDWCQIPAWLGGTWLQRFGRNAVQRGFVQSNDGWWHYMGKTDPNHWKLTKESGSEIYDYAFSWSHQPVINKNASINFRQSTVYFRVNPEKSANGSTNPRIVDIWQEDHQDILRKSAANLLEHSVASRIYSWNGSRLDNAPYPRLDVGSGGLMWTESKVHKLPPHIPIEDPITKNFASREEARRDLQNFLRQPNANRS
ncbi:MAG: hypothetical protein K2X77_32025 [Candidatus Obscuribacterales bacterium]|nr:hypothetical protein [Candidatus Obscuribacterales bacterium]